MKLMMKGLGVVFKLFCAAILIAAIVVAALAKDDVTIISSTTTTMIDKNWECTEWGECLNGVQTRTCKYIGEPNILPVEPVSPEVKKECVATTTTIEETTTTSSTNIEGTTTTTTILEVTSTTTTTSTSTSTTTTTSTTTSTTTTTTLQDVVVNQSQQQNHASGGGGYTLPKCGAWSSCVNGNTTQVCVYNNNTNINSTQTLPCGIIDLHKTTTTRVTSTTTILNPNDLILNPIYTTTTIEPTTTTTIIFGSEELSPVKKPLPWLWIMIGAAVLLMLIFVIGMFARVW